MKLKKFFDAMDTMTRVIDMVIYFAAALLGGWVAFSILGLMEYSLLVQLGGALIGAIMGAALGWIAWKLMQLFA